MSDGGGPPTASIFGVTPEPGSPEALSYDPEQLAQPPPDDTAQAVRSSPLARNNTVLGLLKRADVLLVLLLVVAMLGLIIATTVKRSHTPSVANVSDEFSTVKLPLNGFIAN